MRREDDIAAARHELPDLGHFFVKADVRINVADLIVSARQQVFDRPRLDRRVQLQDVVLKQELLAQWQAEFVDGDRFKFRIERSCMTQVAISNDAVETSFRMVTFGALQHGAREMKIIV